MSVNELIHRVSIETVKNKTECVRRLCFFLFSAGEREHVGLSTWFNEPIRCCADENHTNEFALSLRTPYPITHRIHVHHCHRQPTHTRTHSGSTIVSNSKIQIQWKMSNVRSRLDFLFFFYFFYFVHARRAIQIASRHFVLFQSVRAMCSRQYGLTFYTKDKLIAFHLNWIAFLIFRRENNHYSYSYCFSVSFSIFFVVVAVSLSSSSSTSSSSVFYFISYNTLKWNQKMALSEMKLHLSRKKDFATVRNVVFCALRPSTAWHRSIARIEIGFAISNKFQSTIDSNFTEHLFLWLSPMLHGVGNIVFKTQFKHRNTSLRLHFRCEMMVLR